MSGRQRHIWLPEPRWHQILRRLGLLRRRTIVDIARVSYGDAVRAAEASLAERWDWPIRAAAPASSP